MYIVSCKDLHLLSYCIYTGTNLSGVQDSGNDSELECTLLLPTCIYVFVLISVMYNTAIVITGMYSDRWFSVGVVF